MRVRVCLRMRVCVCVCVCVCFLPVNELHKVLVNVSSQYAYLITCLCTLVKLVVSGLSTFPAVVDCMYDPLMCPRSGELRTQKLKSHLVRTQSLNVLPFKPGVGRYIAIYAALTAREFCLAYFYPSSPFTCIFSKTSPNFFLCWPAE